jgi:beta-galactosidase
LLLDRAQNEDAMTPCRGQPWMTRRRSGRWCGGLLLLVVTRCDETPRSTSPPALVSESAETAGTAASAAYAPPPIRRSDVALDDGWRFSARDFSGAEAPTFDDSGWSRVTLPHSWNPSDGEKGADFGGVGWYRRHFALPANTAGKSFYLTFDGSSMAADVYVNGTSIGEHRGGFARFRFDGSSAMQPGRDNVVAVKVGNATRPEVASPANDFTFFGGSYRDVHLVIADPLHIDTEDYASAGVYLETTNVSSASADLKARVRVRNSDRAAREVTVDTIVVRADGSVAATLSARGTVPAGTTVDFFARATLRSPYLWDGQSDTYLYKAYAELHAGHAVTDWVAVPLGIRSSG